MDIPQILKYKYRIVRKNGYAVNLYKVQFRRPRNKFIAWLTNSLPYRWVDYRASASWEGVPEVKWYHTKDEAKQVIERLQRWDKIDNHIITTEVEEYFK